MARTPKAFTLLVVTTILTLLAIPPAFATSASAIIKAVNAERTARGLAPLAAFGDNSMAKRSNDAFVATGELHGRFKEASSWYRSNGATSVAENQARFPESSGSAKSVAKAWSDSAGHAANQFNKNATHIAAAVTTTGGNVYYTVHILEARSRTSDPEPEPAPKPKPAPKPPPKEPAPEPQAPAKPAQPAPPSEPVADASPAPVPVPVEEVVEPLDIATPRQMTRIEPVVRPTPETPAQLRPAPARSLHGAVLRARFLGLAELAPGDREATARAVLSAVLRAYHRGDLRAYLADEDGASTRDAVRDGEVAASGHRPDADAASAIAMPDASAGLGFAGVGGAVGLLVAALARRPRGRAGGSG